MNFTQGDVILVKDDKKSIIDNLIKGVGGGNFCHTACMISSTDLFEMVAGKGAIIRKVSDYFSKRYTVLVAHNKKLTTKQRSEIAGYLMKLNKDKVKYDYRGVLGHALRLPDIVNHPERLYCSEAVGLAYYAIADYLFSGLLPSEQAPKDQGFDVITKQHIWENDYISH